MKDRMKIEAKLGFDKIRELVEARCATSYARRRVEEEDYSVDPREVMHRQGLADEMRLILMFEGSFPTGGYKDCIHFLKPLHNPESYIALEDMVSLRDSLDILRRVLHFFRNAREDAYPLLSEMAAPIQAFPEILRRMDGILDRFGQVRDDASEALASIRRSMRDMEGSISRRIQSLLREAKSQGLADQDATLSVREGKMLIPISSANKKKFPGIVCDESSSGKTSFIEPLEVVEMNNRIRELSFEEQREILRILIDFTDFLRPYIDDVLQGEEFLGEIDFIMAKASVGSRWQAGKPILSEEGMVILRKARNPLLEEALAREGKKIVPLDIVLTPAKRILLISGPNAGGKSVCLKTVGLLQYMFQWGMPIPASETSELRIFHKFFVDIGDDQSLENDLSTYSSHLLKMKEAVGSADSDSLILVDEFGSGTEPAAGGAIAEEILSEFERRASYGVITTHYSNLKFYADKGGSIINGAMLFDTKRIEPLFKLEIGLPGNSFAFELARKIGLPERIVKGAEERAGKDYVTIERNLRRIARDKREIEERLARVKVADRALDSMTDKYEKELSEIKALRKSVLDEARREAEEIVARANKEVEKTIREIREAQAEKDRTRIARQGLKDFSEELRSREEKAAESEKSALVERKMAQIIERKKRQAQRRAEREARAGQSSNSGSPGTSGSSSSSGRPGSSGSTSAPGGSTAPGTSSEPRGFRIGDNVLIEGRGLFGRISAISSDKATVAIGSIISKVPISDLKLLSSIQFKEAAKTSGLSLSSTQSYDNTSGSSSSSGKSATGIISSRSSEFRTSIDVRGMRIDEAIPVVTHFIDDAIMLGMSTVSILHGKGTGALKEEIRKILKITDGVASFHDEHVDRGGSGITIVHLK